MYKQMIGTPRNYSVLPLLLEIPKLNPNPKKVIHLFLICTKSDVVLKVLIVELHGDKKP